MGTSVLLEPPFLAGSLCLEPRHCGALSSLRMAPASLVAQVSCQPISACPVCPDVDAHGLDRPGKVPFAANITTW